MLEGREEAIAMLAKSRFARTVAAVEEWNDDNSDWVQARCLEMATEDWDALAPFVVFRSELEPSDDLKERMHAWHREHHGTFSDSSAFTHCICWGAMYRIREAREEEQ